MKLLNRNRKPSRVNLLPLARRRKLRWRQWLRIGGWAALGLVIFFGLISLYYYPSGKKALAAAKNIQAIADTLPQDFSDQNFDQAHAHVDDLHAEIAVASDALGKMQGLRAWPYVGRQFKAAEDLLIVGDELAEAVDALVDFADQLFSPFADQGKVSLASISADEKGQLLAGIAEQGPSLRLAQDAVDRAAVALERIPETRLIGVLRDVVDPLKEQFPLIQQGLSQAIPATRILPAVLGYPETKTYLFLLENNTELRPGGGFIGTYGILRLNSGEILSLSTDNSYNLDEAAKSLPTVTPPEPISKYLKVYNWYFRDSNWSPDFPTSAQQALLLYQREGGRKDVDGVMAVTPTMISALLDLVGPITISGLTFDAENFTDQLQEFVDVGFRSVGLAESDRKDIIGPLTTELVDRLLKLPVSEWADLFLVLSQQLGQKQFLLFVEDTAVQGILEDLNWAGSMQSAESSDYVMVVDANLASLKSDPAVERSYSYELQITDQGAEAILTVHYNHTGTFDWKTTRYNSFVRVYVPEGSELIETTGAQLREKSERAGQVTTSTELGKTVFSAFKSVEPGTESQLVLRYKLPARLAEQVQSEQTYQLIFQKQPGLESASIDLQLHLPAKPESVDGLDNQARLGQDSLSFNGPLMEDRIIHLKLKP